MGMHAKPSRAALLAKVGACSGAALALSASGLLVASPAAADGTPPPKVQTADKPKKDQKVKKVKKVNKNKEIEVQQTFIEDDDDADENRNLNGLVNIADINLQLIAQACNNFVPVNVGGGQAAGENLTGAFSFVEGLTTADAGNVKDCEQEVIQQIGDDGGFGDGTFFGEASTAGHSGDNNDDDDDDDDDDDGGGDTNTNVNGLINITDNNLHVPLQACNNFVPVNVGGGQAAGENLTFSGIFAFFGEETGDAETNAENTKDCDQASAQVDDDGGGDGDGDTNTNTNGLVNVTDNNLQVPLQACNNYVPVNVLGGQATGEQLTGAFGFEFDPFGMGDDDESDDSAAAGAENSKDCDQGAGQGDDD